MEQQNEDVHFLIDNVPPEELELTLRALDLIYSKTNEQLQSELADAWGFFTQKHYSNTTRRLQDLGLGRKAGDNNNAYVLTSLGAKIQQLLDTSPEICPDIFHYLHYSGSPKIRKYFLSYKWCSDYVWLHRQEPTSIELVTAVQSKIENEYPDLYQKKRGGNFNAGGVSAWRVWVLKLEPPVFNTNDSNDKNIYLRDISGFQLVLLGLNFLYKTRSYRFGDPVLLDDEFVDSIARIFYLNSSCCRSLLTLASKVTRLVTINDSFAGTTITLNKSYTLEDI